MNKKHGQYKAKIYHIYYNMKARCYNKNTPKYKDWGARGIVICDEWKHDFEAFYNWAMDNGYRDDLSLDRIDVNGNYEPDNCRWVTMKQQARNTRRNKCYTINGKTHCLSEWCEILGLNHDTIRMRLHRGWSIEKH